MEIEDWERELIDMVDSLAATVAVLSDETATTETAFDAGRLSVAARIIEDFVGQDVIEAIRAEQAALTLPTEKETAN